MFPQRTRRQFVRSLPCQPSGGRSCQWIWKKTTLLASRNASSIISWGKVGKPASRMSFPLLVPPRVTDRGMLRVSLNGCTVCCTLPYPRMHSIHLSANPPRHLGIVRFLRDASLIDPQGSRRDMQGVQALGSLSASFPKEIGYTSSAFLRRAEGADAFSCSCSGPALFLLVISVWWTGRSCLYPLGNRHELVSSRELLPLPNCDKRPRVQTSSPCGFA